jgi:hypothetical protein
MPEEHTDMMDTMKKMGEKFSEFKNTWVAHFKDYEIEVLEWNFGVGKSETPEKSYVLDLKAKVAVKPKKK